MAITLQIATYTRVDTSSGSTWTGAAVQKLAADNVTWVNDPKIFVEFIGATPAAAIAMLRQQFPILPAGL